MAEIFSLMSRDEARHAGFLNKAMSDFNLALDLGFLTKNRKYTFFKPQYIFYATYLSEKVGYVAWQLPLVYFLLSYQTKPEIYVGLQIGYWRYISIYRHLQRNPDNQLYPLFEYFENWCQDENRHGDFVAALLKSQPQVHIALASCWCSSRPHALNTKAPLLCSSLMTGRPSCGRASSASRSM